MSRGVDAGRRAVVGGAGAVEVGALVDVVLDLVTRGVVFESLAQAANVSVEAITVATTSADRRVIAGRDGGVAARTSAGVEWAGERPRAWVVGSPPVG